MRGSGTGERRLEKTVKDQRRATGDLLGRGHPAAEQRIQAWPQLLQKGISGNPRKEIGIQHLEKFWVALFTYENNDATSQMRNHLVEGSHNPSWWQICLLRIKDRGIRFFLLKERARLFEGRSDKTLIPHAPEQNAHVVAHQRIDAKHQHFGLDLGGFHRQSLARTVFQASTATT